MIASPASTIFVLSAARCAHKHSKTWIITYPFVLAAGSASLDSAGEELLAVVEGEAAADGSESSIETWLGKAIWRLLGLMVAQILHRKHWQSYQISECWVGWAC